MELKLWKEKLLYILVIVLGGFVLFIIAFMLAFLVNKVFSILLIPFSDNISGMGQIVFFWHYLYLIIVLLLSWFILRTGLNDLVKATFFTMPLMVVLIEVGLQLYRWSILVWGIDAVIVGAVFIYLYKKKCSWMYYFATFYVAAVNIFIMLSGMDI